VSGNSRLVKRLYEAFNRGDVEGCMALIAPDAQYDLTRSLGPYAGMYEGRETVADLMRSYLDAWQELRWEPQEFIEPRDGVVVVPVIASAVGGGSGIDVGAEITHAYAVSDGLVTGMALFQSTGEALAFAGLG
jgi:ketosteroid isomerase-like protein